MGALHVEAAALHIRDLGESPLEQQRGHGGPRPRPAPRGRRRRREHRPLRAHLAGGVEEIRGSDDPLGPEEGALQPRALSGQPSPVGSPAVPVEPCLQRGERAVRLVPEATRQLGVPPLTPGETQQEPEVRGGVHAGPAQPRVERLQRLEGRRRAAPEEAAAGAVGAKPLESGPESLEAIGPHRHGSLAPGREQRAAEGAETVGERGQLRAEVLGTPGGGAGPGGLQLRVEAGELALLEHQRREAARDQ